MKTRLNQKNIKTSVSMPSPAAQAFTQYHRQILSHLDGYLREFKKDTPRRDRLREYNRGDSPVEHLNVFWSMADYNKLHQVACALRLSVSFLLYQILMFILSGGKAKAVVSNYSFNVIAWSEKRLQFQESLVFRPWREAKKTNKHRT